MIDAGRVETRFVRTRCAAQKWVGDARFISALQRDGWATPRNVAAGKRILRRKKATRPAKYAAITCRPAWLARQARAVRKVLPERRLRNSSASRSAQQAVRRNWLKHWAVWQTRTEWRVWRPAGKVPAARLSLSPTAQPDGNRAGRGRCSK